MFDLGIITKMKGSPSTSFDCSLMSDQRIVAARELKISWGKKYRAVQSVLVRRPSNLEPTRGFEQDTNKSSRIIRRRNKKCVEEVPSFLPILVT